MQVKITRQWNPPLGCVFLLSGVVLEPICGHFLGFIGTGLFCLSNKSQKMAINRLERSNTTEVCRFLIKSFQIRSLRNSADADISSLGYLSCPTKPGEKQRLYTRQRVKGDTDDKAETN